MKILFAGFSKIKYMPYMNFYLSAADRESSEVHVIYWNRDLADEDLSALAGVTLHEFRKSQPDDAPKLSKLKSFREYRKYALSVLDEVKPDRVVILHSLPGILLYGRLMREYSGRYIFDYRDYTYEGFPPYQTDDPRACAALSLHVRQQRRIQKVSAVRLRGEDIHLAQSA